MWGLLGMGGQRWWQKKEGKRKTKGEALFVFIQMVAGKGEPSELWVHGGCCLGNVLVGLAVVYVMSQALEAPILTAGL